jgi:hypothetical protein
MHGESDRLACDKRRMFHEELGLIRPARDIERLGFRGGGRRSRSATASSYDDKQDGKRSGEAHGHHWISQPLTNSNSISA